MAKKKKAAKSSDVSEMVHFRPGKELGLLIGQLADQSSISRGEAARRLASLAIRGLDIGLYGEIEALMPYLYGAPGFDEAAHHVHIAVQEVAEQLGVEVVQVPSEEKTSAVRQLLNRYRSMREFEEEAKEKRISIKIIRTDE